MPISTGENHAPPNHALFNTAARTVANSTANTTPTADVQLKNRAISAEESKIYTQSLKPSTPINVDILESLLTNHPDPSFVSFVCTGLRNGFQIGYEGARQPYFAKNLKSAYIHPEIVDDNLLNEVKLGRTAGPFKEIPFPCFQVYPIGLVPKKHTDK